MPTELPAREPAALRRQEPLALAARRRIGLANGPYGPLAGRFGGRARLAGGILLLLPDLEGAGGAKAEGFHRR